MKNEKDIKNNNTAEIHNLLEETKYIARAEDEAIVKAIQANFEEENIRRDEREKIYRELSFMTPKEIKETIPLQEEMKTITNKEWLFSLPNEILVEYLNFNKICYCHLMIAIRQCISCETCIKKWLDKEHKEMENDEQGMAE